MDAVPSIVRAIAAMEGFYKPGSLASRNNNPGNLRSWGSLPVKDGYVVFPNVEKGWEALRRQTRKNIDRGLTLEEFFSGKPGVYPGYAPSADGNQPMGYARFVASASGVPLGVPIRQFEAGESPAPAPIPAPRPTELEADIEEELGSGPGLETGAADVDSALILAAAAAIVALALYLSKN
jgi:hypothetical protein